MSAKIFNLTGEKRFAGDVEHSGLGTPESAVSQAGISRAPSPCRCFPT